MDPSGIKDKYIIECTTPEDPLLEELARTTFLKVLNPRMLSGHFQGKLLEMISRMVNPSMILEIGTFTGYSAICMARGLRDGGILHTFDINDEIRDLAWEYICRAGLSEKVIMHTGNAIDLIPSVSGEPDLVFIDGEKKEYADYYELILPMVRKGGFIIADNVLWNDKAWDPDYIDDPYTRSIRKFNEMISKDNRVENILLPVRDGLMLMRKK